MQSMEGKKVCSFLFKLLNTHELPSNVNGDLSCLFLMQSAEPDQMLLQGKKALLTSGSYDIFCLYFLFPHLSIWGIRLYSMQVITLKTVVCTYVHQTNYNPGMQWYVQKLLTLYLMERLLLPSLSSYVYPIPRSLIRYDVRVHRSKIFPIYYNTKVPL